jgi:lysophospholipase L1-like esterase
MGDSLLATNTLSGRSIAQVIEASLGEEVIDRSVRGARFLYNLPITGSLGLNVSKQYQPGAWDWVVLNGGGNDLWLGCGCQRCETTISRLISPYSSHGEIPRVVNYLRSNRTRVIYVGYLRTPGVETAIDHCRDEGNELEQRIRNMADSDPGFYFLSVADLVPDGDRTFHAADMIHPSVKASTAIGQRIAALIRSEGG